MIFVAGDTHLKKDAEKLYIIKNKYPQLSKEDIVIVVGDFEGCLDDKAYEVLKEMMQKLPYTIAFVDGNHENFDKLNTYPVCTWHNAKCHKLLDDCYHIMRGEILNLEGMNFLCIGGGESTTKWINSPIWWKEESITIDDINNANINLAKVNNKVDYVITHCPTFTNLKKLSGHQELNPNKKYTSEEILEKLNPSLAYKQWFFGHYHLDEVINEKQICLYKGAYLIKVDNITKIC